MKKKKNSHFIKDLLIQKKLKNKLTRHVYVLKRKKKFIYKLKLKKKNY